MSVKASEDAARTGARPATVVRRRLRRMAHDRVRLDALEAELARERQELEARYERRLDARRNRLDRMRDELETYCRRHRQEIFPDGRKSLETPLGKVGFRRSGASVRLQSEVDRGEASRRLERLGLERFVRIRRSPDRRALNRALREGELTRDLLADCGMEVVEGAESFHCAVEGAGRRG